MVHEKEGRFRALSSGTEKENGGLWNKAARIWCAVLAPSVILHFFLLGLIDVNLSKSQRRRSSDPPHSMMGLFFYYYYLCMNYFLSCGAKHCAGEAFGLLLAATD